MKLVTSKKQGGFTLVELVMVIVVIALLSAYIGPKFASLESQARTAQINKISGILSESVGVVKAISIAELDASVADVITDFDSRTGVDFDGSNSTGNATANSPLITLTGEDIATEFHFPKASNGDLTLLELSDQTLLTPAITTPTAAEASSILFAVDISGTETTIVLMADDAADATILNFKGACGYGTTDVDNNGGALNSLENTLIAVETLADATTAGTDTVRIYHCGMLNNSDYNTAALDGQLLTISNCSVTYTDAGLFTAAGTLDTFQNPSVTVQAGGC